MKEANSKRSFSNQLPAVGSSEPKSVLQQRWNRPRAFSVQGCGEVNGPCPASPLFYTSNKWHFFSQSLRKNHLQSGKLLREPELLLCLPAHTCVSRRFQPPMGSPDRKWLPSTAVYSMYNSLHELQCKAGSHWGIETQHDGAQRRCLGKKLTRDKLISPIFFSTFSLCSWCLILSLYINNKRLCHGSLIIYCTEAVSRYLDAIFEYIVRILNVHCQCQKGRCGHLGGIALANRHEEMNWWCCILSYR